MQDEKYHLRFDLSLWSIRLYWLYIHDFEPTLILCVLLLHFLLFSMMYVDQRKHGNRIMREFLLGPKNIQRLDPQTKCQE